MKTTVYICFFTVLIFLSSCDRGGEEETVEEVKIDFFVDTTLGSEFSGGSRIEKVGQVRSSQDIDLTANIAGRVTAVNVKTGDRVAAGQVIARLTDNIGNIVTSLERANNGIDRARINYDSNLLSLNKQIFDSEQAIDNLERQLRTTREDAEQNIRQGENTLANATADSENTTNTLQLEQVDNNIEKALLDYENKLIADQETIDGFIVTLDDSFESLQRFLDDVIQFSDEILGVTPENEDENDDFDYLLGAEDINKKNEAKRNLETLINIRESLEFSNRQSALRIGNISEEEIIENIDYIENVYDLSDELLDNLEMTLNRSLISVGILGQQEIDTFVGQVNAFQGTLAGNLSGFNSFSTSAESFLRTYENAQESLLASIELQREERNILERNLENSQRNLNNGETSAEIALERTRIASRENIEALEEQLETARENLELARRNKTVTLRSQQNAITSANIDYNSALRDANKLTITSPINGTISEVQIDVGQEVGNGTSLFEIISDSTPEVEIALSRDETAFVRIGQEVRVEVNDDIITGTIYAISDVADENLNYKTTIVFDSGTSIIGNLVNVVIPIETGKRLFPLNIIEVQGDEIGLVTTLSGSIFDSVRVRMGEVYGNFVEIVSCAKDCSDLNIVTNDISNFDPNRFVIVER